MQNGWLVAAVALGAGFYLASRSPLLATSVKLAILCTWAAFTFLAPAVVIWSVYLPQQRIGAIVGTLVLTAFLAAIWLATCPKEIRKTLRCRDNFALWRP